jgi:AcrR family transcriptional regulator
MSAYTARPKKETIRSNGPAPPPTRGVRQGAHVVEMQRRRLMLAVVELVGENGLEAATVGRICEQAGVSRRTFYELFEDREGCLLAAFDSQLERLGESIRPVFDSAGRWRERVRRALVVLLEQFDADPNVACFCLIETPRAGPRMIERRTRVLDGLVAGVEEGRGEARAGNEPPLLTGQGIVGGALSVIHARLLADRHPAEYPRPRVPDARTRPLVDLVGPLMAMIVHPYLGASAARKELERPEPAVLRKFSRNTADPFKGLPIRFTYRTALVMATIASDPGASNRHIADRAGIADEGQTSRLLRRLQGCELIENEGKGHVKGEPNAWKLTQRGEAIHKTITTHPNTR